MHVFAETGPHLADFDFMEYNQSQEGIGMENKPKRVHGAVGLVIGVPLGAIGASLMKHGSLGMTPFYSVSLALYEATGMFTMGTWNTIFQVALVLALIVIRRKFFPRYVLSFAVAACASMILDGCNLLAANLPGDLLTRILSFAFGFLIMAVGIAILAKCKLPVAPMNLFPRELAEVYHKEFRQFKLWFDLGCLGFTLAVSWLFAGRLVGVGVGTLVAVLTGPLTGVIIRWMAKRVEFYA